MCHCGRSLCSTAENLHHTEMCGALGRGLRGALCAQWRFDDGKRRRLDVFEGFWHGLRAERMKARDGETVRLRRDGWIRWRRMHCR